MIGSSHHQQQQHKATLLISPRQSPVSNSTTTRGGKASKSRGWYSWCGGLDDCINMGSTSKLEQQKVADLEREVLKQKELRIMYRKRMERTQDYLKYCLQVAQDNGFLGLIMKTKDDDDHDHGNVDDPQFLLPPPPPPQPLSSAITTAAAASPPPLATPTMQHQLSDLPLLVTQAKINGWYIDHHEIELQEKIAEGTTAAIYKAIWRGLDVAAKCMFPDFFNSNENGVTFFAQEVETLSRQRHRFVLQLMGACLDPPNQAWVVTEFLGKTLKEWIHGPGGSRRREKRTSSSFPLPWLGERIGRALEIAQAMQYLHEQKPKVIHRDLKPSNIFLDDANHVRVADFGHARFLSGEEKALTGETGTYVYMAPEVIRCEPYNEKCDVYSFGIILNELITGDHPYIETDYGPTKIAMEVAEGNLRPALPEDDDSQLGELINLITMSWDQDDSIRPSFIEITSLLRKYRNRFI